MGHPLFARISQLASLLVFLLAFPAAASAAVDYSRIVENESAYIAGLQQPSGAVLSSLTAKVKMSVGGSICTTGVGDDYYKIEPYQSNLAVLGMLEHPSADNLAAAKKWIGWYIGHTNAPDYNGVTGTVYVHYAKVSDGTEVHCGKYDSSDSYAATFMSVLKKYAESGGDTSYLITHRTAIETIADAMTATLTGDGLTWAKPDYKIKYLMDNSEVYDGYGSIAWLEQNVFGDAAKSADYASKQTGVQNGIETLLWQPAADKYKHYYYTSPSVSTNWTTFYADATSQLWPMMFGVISPASTRASDLYTTFNTYHPGWSSMKNTTSFPWSNLTLAAAMLDDRERVDNFMASARSNFFENGHPYPWYNNQSGFAIRAAKLIRDKTNLAYGSTVTASAYGAEAGKLTDGSLLDGWTGGATDSEWVQIDLGASKPFNRIVLKWNADYADQYSIQVSDDGAAYTNAHTETSGNGGTDDIATSPYDKRYIKILMTHRSSAGGPGLKEIEVYQAEGPNLALGGTASASGNTASAGLAIDGGVGSRWESVAADNQWYKIDLGSSRTINRIMLDWQRTAYDAAYSIQLSDDDISYSTVYATTTGDGGMDDIRFASTSARYVKILLTTRAAGSTKASLWEAGVYNDPF
ncbi:discoidin domain-containing protein [Paenibacillus hemerocallicola]|uniref:Discoidin domain-containing protein n=1 Tax=Paenibacillus hemerocallicola TaxID=1172614 RepID=A0A5C4SZ52_9BACL|nr:discoidin domain-containing protein [Paenibacillus hemerocallicola]TNJ61953.1 discoidin domain-containing protein [Paenibacillus hemerocallicola]